jgi:transposase
MTKLTINQQPTHKKTIPLTMAIANQIIKELQLVEKINQTTTWNPTHWNTSPGTLAKILILTTFTDMRIPLTRIAQRIEPIDVEYFLSPEDKTNQINEYNVAEALDRIADIDYEQMYQTIALTALQKYNIPIGNCHSDTTTLSFYGEYDVDNGLLTEEEIKTLFKIERGYNKDHRPKAKQALIGQITTQTGLPIVHKIQSGSTSDIDWNREALNYIQQIRTQGFATGLYVADSKLMTKEHVTRMNSSINHIDFVSRCPANFSNKLESKTIAKAYAGGEWVEFGCFSEPRCLQLSWHGFYARGVWGVFAFSGS